MGSSNMILFVVTSFFSGQVLGDPIIGGRSSNIYEYPWLASIQKGGYHKCGGSIISHTIILTAAHCTEDPPYYVRVGSTRTDSGGSLHEVVTIKRHENYNSTRTDWVDSRRYDVALIRVSPPIILGKNGASIQLAKKGYVAAARTNVTAAGWGSMSPEDSVTYQLRSVNLNTIDDGECAREFTYSGGTWTKSNRRSCAFGHGNSPCKGDFGGPLVLEEDVQVGIMTLCMHCAYSEYAGVYEKVALYRDWIDNNSQNL